MQIPMSRNKSNQPTYGYDEYKTCVTLWNYIEWSIYNIYIFIIYYSTWEECIYNMYNMGCYRVYWTYLRPVYFSAYTVSAHWFSIGAHWTCVISRHCSCLQIPWFGLCIQSVLPGILCWCVNNSGCITCMLFLFFLLEFFVRSIHYFYICLFLFDFLNLYILCFIGVHTYLQYIDGFLSLCFVYILFVLACPFKRGKHMLRMSSQFGTWFHDISWNIKCLKEQYWLQAGHKVSSGSLALGHMHPIFKHFHYLELHNVFVKDWWTFAKVSPCFSPPACEHLTTSRGSHWMTVLKRTCPISQWDEGHAVIRDLELEAYHNNDNSLNFHSSKAQHWDLRRTCSWSIFDNDRTYVE